VSALDGAEERRWFWRLYARGEGGGSCLVRRLGWHHCDGGAGCSLEQQELGRGGGGGALAFGAGSGTFKTINC
jgi:hypothetical protein